MHLSRSGDDVAVFRLQTVHVFKTKLKHMVQCETLMGNETGSGVNVPVCKIVGR